MVTELEEKFDATLEAFDKGREFYDQEMLKIKADLHRLIDNLFEDLVRKTAPIINQTELFMEGRINEFRTLSKRKTELLRIKEKLDPLLDALRH